MLQNPSQSDRKYQDDKYSRQPEQGTQDTPASHPADSSAACCTTDSSTPTQATNPAAVPRLTAFTRPQEIPRFTAFTRPLDYFGISPRATLRPKEESVPRNYELVSRDTTRLSNYSRSSDPFHLTVPVGPSFCPKNRAQPESRNPMFTDDEGSCGFPDKISCSLADDSAESPIHTELSRSLGQKRPNFEIDERKASSSDFQQTSGRTSLRHTFPLATGDISDQKDRINYPEKIIPLDANIFTGYLEDGRRTEQNSSGDRSFVRNKSVSSHFPSSSSAPLTTEAGLGGPEGWELPESQRIPADVESSTSSGSDNTERSSLLDSELVNSLTDQILQLWTDYGHLLPGISLRPTSPLVCAPGEDNQSSRKRGAAYRPRGQNSHGRRKAINNSTDESPGDGDEENENHDDDRPCSQKGGPDSSPDVRPSYRRLRCPFNAFNPQRYSDGNLAEMNYRNCSTCVLRNISILKQHLERVHGLPKYYCRRCFEVFRTNDLLHLHNREPEQCEVDKYSPFSDRISEDQIAAIKHRDPGKTEKEKWYIIYQKLFPKSSRPASPYVDHHPNKDVQNFLEFFRRTGPAIIADALTQGGFQDSMIHYLEERRILEFALEKIVDNYRNEDGLDYAGDQEDGNQPSQFFHGSHNLGPSGDLLNKDMNMSPEILCMGAQHSQMIRPSTDFPNSYLGSMPGPTPLSRVHSRQELWYNHMPLQYAQQPTMKLSPGLPNDGIGNLCQNILPSRTIPSRHFHPPMLGDWNLGPQYGNPDTGASAVGIADIGRVIGGVEPAIWGEDDVDLCNSQMF